MVLKELLLDWLVKFFLIILYELIDASINVLKGKKIELFPDFDNGGLLISHSITMG